MKNVEIPFVYIIIVNWNGFNETCECLKSLKKITYKNYKIIVVDNGSNNNEGKKIKEKFDSIHLIKNKMNTGFVVANNQGIKYAIKNNADQILLLNNDTVVSSDFLEPLSKVLSDKPTIGAISPKILYYKSNKIWSMGGNISKLTGISMMIGKGKLSKTQTKRVYPDFLTGCAFLIRSSLIKEVGLLDPIYFAYYEDVDWSYRIRKVGYKIMTVPNSIIFHKKSASAGIVNSNKKESSFQTFQITKNGIIFFKNNYSIFNKIETIILFSIFRLVYVVIFSGFKNIRSYFEGLWAGIHQK